jgi:hypothetical protein
MPQRSYGTAQGQGRTRNEIGSGRSWAPLTAVRLTVVPARPYSDRAGQQISELTATAPGTR